MLCTRVDDSLDGLRSRRLLLAAMPRPQDHQAAASKDRTADVHGVRSGDTGWRECRAATRTMYKLQSWPSGPRIYLTPAADGEVDRAGHLLCAHLDSHEHATVGARQPRALRAEPSWATRGRRSSRSTPLRLRAIQNEHPIANRDLDLLCLDAPRKFVRPSRP